MKILQINASNHGSTGKIMLQLAEKAEEAGHIAYSAFANVRENKKTAVKNQILIGNRFSRNLHLKLSYYTGLEGCFSFFSTLRFLKKIDRIKPDLIHLHNLHICYINLPLLFSYIKKKEIRTVWTLHDCWPFTGHCPHFQMADCDKWKEGCFSCPIYKQYPKSFSDNAKKMYRFKKKWFTGVKDLTVVTPSHWLAFLVKESFLKDYPVKVIHNGIDLRIFKPITGNFRDQYKIGDKYIILGVANPWSERKGLDVFIELSKRLDDRFQIVLVGTNDKLDKSLPENIISVHKTKDQAELAQIYSSADLFVNPTREENYPTVNMEAVACGTPVLTFRTGGSPEILDEFTGSVVEKNDVDAMYEKIVSICENKEFSTEEILKRAEKFDMNERFCEYIKLYEGFDE